MTVDQPGGSIETGYHTFVPLTVTIKWPKDTDAPSDSLHTRTLRQTALANYYNVVSDGISKLQLVCRVSISLTLSVTLSLTKSVSL